MLDYQLTTFENGLRVITAPMKETKATTVLCLLNVGSRYEEERLNGISHFLEHMVFKGTKKRPTTLDISKALDSVGADYNAFTSEEYTGFYVRSASNHFDLALDIIYDVLFNPKFEEGEIEKEKAVITEEINMRLDIPQVHVYDLLKEIIFPAHPLGRSTVGEKKTVSSFSQKDLFDYRDKFYTGKNMILSVAGGGEPEVWKKKIHELFEEIPASSKNKFISVSKKEANPSLKIYQKKTDQAHLLLAFPTLPRTDSRRPIFKVMNNLFGETMSSRLFTEIREKRGLAYYINSELMDFQDKSVFMVALGVDIARAEEAIKVILEEFNKIKTAPIKPEELVRAKENLKGRLYLSLEESFSVAEFLADQELFWEKIKDPDGIIKEIEVVESSQIQQLASQYFIADNLNLALIGPLAKKDKFQALLANFN